MSFAEEIEKLSELKKSGAMSEDEFQEAKSRLLSTLPPPTASHFKVRRQHTHR